MSIRAVSPLDGRYQRQTEPLGVYVSEWALMKYRLWVEVRWLMAMAATPELPHIRPLTAPEVALLEALVQDFDDSAAAQIKAIERTTNHDVKAVEYYLRDALAQTSLADVSGFIHFCCTSEDINNLAYALMLRDAMQQVWLPSAEALLDTLADLAASLAAVPMLARTHGQAATPSTLGKELAVFLARADRQIRQLRAQAYYGKFNGAVGAFNAHVVAYPQADWTGIAEQFVSGLGLTYNPLTTQIEPHDGIAELAHTLTRFNTVLLDLCRDMWTYISLGYFKQQVVAGEVGSSTMPHKVNPIDFENAEANVGLSSALLTHLAEKLPVSRLQRDLSDSSVMRNYGVALAHSLLALQSAKRGLGKVAANPAALQADLNGAWEVLGEAVQTVLRKHNIPDAYEQLKALTRGQGVSQGALQTFINGLNIPAEDRAALLALSPQTYIGLAETLTMQAVAAWRTR